MHLNFTLTVLFCIFLPFLSASPLASDEGTSSAPSETPSLQAVTSTTSKSAFGVSRALSTHGAVTHRPIAATNTHNPGHPISTSVKKQPFVSNRPNNPTPPRPHWVPPPAASSTSFVNRHSPHGPNESTAAIVFEALGALAGLLLFLGLMRCLYNYHRTPNRDRIAAVLHRHQLQREMDELARNPPQLRRRSMEPPPPPYLAPPVYPDDETSLLTRAPAGVTTPYADNPNG